MPKQQRAVLIEQAVAWLLKMEAHPLSASEQKEWEDWCAQSAQHRYIWAQATKLQQNFSELPSEIALPVLENLKHSVRKKRNRKIYAWLMLPFTAMFYYYLQQQMHVFADYRNYSYQPKQIQLADQTKIVLNVGTAIDVDYQHNMRKIRLRQGAIWIETAKDNQQRPFLVETEQGRAQALGTQYLVAKQKDYTQVAIAQGAVKLTTAGNGIQKIIYANQQLRFDQRTIGETGIFDGKQYAWAQGYLVVHDLSLAEFIKKLKPYSKARMTLDPELEQLRISGTYPLFDQQQLYRMLEQTYALRINSSLAGYLLKIEVKK